MFIGCAVWCVCMFKDVKHSEPDEILQCSSSISVIMLKYPDPKQFKVGSGL